MKVGSTPIDYSGRLCAPLWSVAAPMESTRKAKEVAASHSEWTRNCRAMSSRGGGRPSCGRLPASLLPEEVIWVNNKRRAWCERALSWPSTSSSQRPATTHPVRAPYTILTGPCSGTSSPIDRDAMPYSFLRAWKCAKMLLSIRRFSPVQVPKLCGCHHRWKSRPCLAAWSMPLRIRCT